MVVSYPHQVIAYLNALFSLLDVSITGIVLANNMPMEHFHGFWSTTALLHISLGVRNFEPLVSLAFLDRCNLVEKVFILFLDVHVAQ